MSHQNIFNSAAARAKAERNFKIFNRAALVAGIIGLGCFAGVLFGSDNKAVVAGAGLGLAANILTGDYRRKKEALLDVAKNDIYTP